MPIIRFHPPANNERDALRIEALLDGWMAMCGKEGMALGIVYRQGRIEFCLSVPETSYRVIAMQLANAFPGGKLEPVAPTSDVNQLHQSLRLSPDWNYIESSVGADSVVDPLEAMLEVLKVGKTGDASSELWLELLPCKEKDLRNVEVNSSYRDARFPLASLKKWFAAHASNRSRRIQFAMLFIRMAARRSKLIELPPKLKARLYSATIRLSVTAKTDARRLVKRKSHELLSALQLVCPRDSTFFVENRRKNPFLITAREVATLWHFPTTEVHVPRVAKQQFQELEPPAGLANPDKNDRILTLGRVAFRSDNQKFGIDLEARRRHLFVLGKTGMGKTTLLLNIIREDMLRRRGLAVIEPHGDLAEATLRHLPKFRKNDLVYFDPADSNGLSFNPLMVPNGSDKTLVADGVLTAFQKVFGLDESQAPRLLHIFRNCLFTLVENPGTTLMDVQRLLVEPLYLKTMITRVNNPVVKSFWIDEFGKWSHNDRTFYIASLQNKLGAFLTNDKLQRVLGDPNAKLDLRRIMDDGKILVINLSKGRLGENASELLGTLIVTSLQLAAMSRANIPESDRRDFSIVVDEFQNFATPSIATFLSEARKYRVHLILANQYTSQIPPATLDAIIGNVGSQILFQLGPNDAERFAQTAFAPLTAESFLNLPKYHAYAKLLRDGMQTAPFSMQTIFQR